MSLGFKGKTGNHEGTTQMKGKLFEPIFPNTNYQKASKIWDHTQPGKKLK